MTFNCSSHGRGTRPHPILDDDPETGHPLGSNYAVGDRSPAAVRKDAATLVAFKIGEKVTTAHGNTGIVRSINPADYEVKVQIDGTNRMLWFCPAELTAE